MRLPFIDGPAVYVTAPVARWLARPLLDALVASRNLGTVTPDEVVATIRAIDELAERSELGTGPAEESERRSHSERRVLTAAQAAEVLGCSVRQVRALISEGAIPAVKPGWAWQIEADVIDDYAAALRKGNR